MRSLPVRLYAAFPARTFGGNIAGVVYDDVGLSPEEMQGIAAELGAPTTGFIRRREDTTMDVRFFSSRSEMGICGHVTIGIFTWLFDDKLISQDYAEYHQVTPAGEIIVSVEKQAAVPHVSMKQLPPRFDLIRATSAEIAPMLGVPTSTIQSIGSSSTALRHLFVELANEAALAAINPDDETLRSFSDTRAIDTIGVWCFQGANQRGTRLRLRDLCHGVGDPEEAASGTTNGALACLAWRGGRTNPDDAGNVTVIAEQGFEMGRPSLIVSQLKTSRDSVVEVRVGGTAVRRLTGTYVL